jgi:hypothetical protein
MLMAISPDVNLHLPADTIPFGQSGSKEQTVRFSRVSNSTPERS